MKEGYSTFLYLKKMGHNVINKHRGKLAFLPIVVVKIECLSAKADSGMEILFGTEKLDIAKKNSRKAIRKCTNLASFSLTKTTSSNVYVQFLICWFRRWCLATWQSWIFEGCLREHFRILNFRINIRELLSCSELKMKVLNISKTS